ncbi:MAG: type IX secretion system sortase PorU [Bacteroidales bacterium]
MKKTRAAKILVQMMIALLIPVLVKGQEKWVNSSVLATGQWVKLAVTSGGVYRIDYSKLKQLGFSNPANPRLFGNNFGQLSYYNNDPKPDDLKEIPVFLSKGSDGIFNEGDYLLFYSSPTHRWRYNAPTGEYSFSRHNYSDTVFYFITSTLEPGKMISEAVQNTSPANYVTSSTDMLYCHENETENLIKSGREWYEPVSVFQSTPISPAFPDLIAGESIRYTARVLARASVPTTFRFQDGESIISSILVPEVYLMSTTGTYARDVLTTGNFIPSSDQPLLAMKYVNGGETGARGWIDYVWLQARGSAVFSGKTREIFDSRTIDEGRISQFNVKSSSADLIIWEITDPMQPATVQYSRSGDNCRFTVNTDSLRKFVAFSLSSAAVPVFHKGFVTNQDLHGSDDADMIILTHPLFTRYAGKLASVHLAASGLKSLIVTPEMVYNEFSGGIPDIVAIRNFIRMKYIEQAGSRPLRYLLLFGDGSFENKTAPPDNPNFIPTYQSQNSTVVVSSFTSDDFYGLLEDGEGEADGTEDIGIGRFPVSDTASAGILVEKVRKYIAGSAAGDWRNVIALCADDEDGNAHMSDAEGLYSFLNTSYPEYNIDKIYFDAFKQVTSVNGQTYPDVTRKINDRINAGCLIFNYLGHGNEIGLAHERVVKTENINSWKNGAMLPLFITATCEFSRFDDIDINPVNRKMTGKTSAGELVILNNNGGAIALMTTTRVVYSAPNYTLNRNIYNYAFKRDEKGQALALGDIIKLAKRNSGNGMNKRNFLLLGDPALRLAWPWHGSIVTDSINHKSVNLPADSLKALSDITVSGHLDDTTGTLKSNFNGVVSVIVYDKAGKVRTLANDGGSVMEFDLRNNIIFSGKAQAVNGRFSFSFVVPRDINYSFGNGKISYYAGNSGIDMNGFYGDVVVGGFSNKAANDTSGPRIMLYLNDTLFRNGGISGTDPVLLAIIEDDGGINTTGSGIGHDLTAYLDGDRNKSFVLNDYFETDLNNYRKGHLVYPVSLTDRGLHTISVKAWDNYNNSAEATLVFVIRGEDGFILTNLINFPNPFEGETRISAEHNRPDARLAITIDIFNMNGMKIKRIEQELESTGYRLPPVLWDGNDDRGGRVGRGIYPYTVTVRTSDGEVSRVSGRMIIL